MPTEPYREPSQQTQGIDLVGDAQMIEWARQLARSGSPPGNATPETSDTLQPPVRQIRQHES